MSIFENVLFVPTTSVTFIAGLRRPEGPPEQSPIPIGSGNLCMYMENQMVIHAFHFSWSEWPVRWFAGASRRRWCHTSYPGPLLANRRKFFFHTLSVPPLPRHLAHRHFFTSAIALQKTRRSSKLSSKLEYLFSFV